MEPVETRHNPSRPVETRLNLSKHVSIRSDLLKPVETRFNPFRSVQTRFQASPPPLLHPPFSPLLPLFPFLLGGGEGEGEGGEGGRPGNVFQQIWTDWNVFRQVSTGLNGLKFIFLNTKHLFFLIQSILLFHDRCCFHVFFRSSYIYVVLRLQWQKYSWKTFIFLIQSILYFLISFRIMLS